MACFIGRAFTRRSSARLPAMLALSALVALGAVAATTAHGQDRRDGRHFERGRGWGGGYYPAPPIVYGQPYYAPPPIYYGPSIGVYMPGLSIGIQ